MASDEAGRRRRPQARELGLLDQEGAQELGRRGALLPGELRRGKGDPRACGAAVAGVRRSRGGRGCSCGDGAALVGMVDGLGSTENKEDGQAGWIGRDAEEKKSGGGEMVRMGQAA